MSDSQLARIVHPGATAEAMELALPVAAEAVIAIAQAHPVHVRQVWVDMNGNGQRCGCARSLRIHPGVVNLPLDPVTISYVVDSVFADAVVNCSAAVARTWRRSGSIRAVRAAGHALSERVADGTGIIDNGLSVNERAQLSATVNLLDWAFGPDAAEVFDDAWEVAPWLFVENRHAIRLVAGELTRRRELDYWQITDMVRPYLRATFSPDD